MELGVEVAVGFVVGFGMVTVVGAGDALWVGVEVDDGVGVGVALVI